MKLFGKILAVFGLMAGISSAVYSQAPISVSIPGTVAENGVTIFVPIRVGDLTGRNVIAFQAVVVFDEQVLNATGASSTGTLSEAFGAPTVNANVDGRISFGGFGTAPLNGSGTLVNLNFKVVGQSGQTTALTFLTFIFNSGHPAAAISGGILKVAPLNQPHIFTVTNTNDSGSGSLRKATLDANTTPNLDTSTPDTIKFNIAGAGPHAISPLSALPAITDPVIMEWPLLMPVR